MTKNGMSYKDSGVDYGAMDPFKRACQMAAKQTAKNMERFGLKEVGSSRGESAYLFEAADCLWGYVEEGLGTKNLVADAVRKYTGETYYDKVAQCTLAMIINDLITLGALPVVTAMHVAVGSSDWFEDEQRYTDLIQGWQKACHMARCAWGGGETPTLKGIVEPGTAVLSGSGIGIVKPKSMWIDHRDIEIGDVIMLIGSSGIHANGLTMARKIAEKLPRGYEQLIEPGHVSYGEAILMPTIIYARLIEECLNQGVDIHYTVNITGHGWRKLMRAEENLRYIIEKVPEPQAVFRVIQEYGKVSDRDMYGDFNMGAGFALYVPERDAEEVENIAESLQMNALKAGFIEGSPDEDKHVIIEPKGLEYSGQDLQVR